MIGESADRTVGLSAALQKMQVGPQLSGCHCNFYMMQNPIATP